MKRIRTYEEFIQRVRTLSSDEVKDLGLKPSAFTGSFDFDRLVEVFQFCYQKPEYHIVSIVSGLMYINTFVPSANQFLLARGDADPNLVFIPSLSLETYQKRLVTKLWGREQRSQANDLESLSVSK